jgi:hypothetical protein
MINFIIIKRGDFMVLETYVGDLGSIFFRMGENIILALPSIILALLILVIGFLIAVLIRVILERLLIKIKLDNHVIENTGMKKLIGGFKLSHFLAVIAKWYVFILFFPLAAEILGLNNVSNFLIRLSWWIPNFIAAIIIAIFGILFATYVKHKVEHINFHNAIFVSNIAYVIVLLFTFIIAFEQIGINISIVSDSFLIILAGIMFAVGLGFGLGMKSEAEKIIKSWRKKL